MASRPAGEREGSTGGGSDPTGAWPGALHTSCEGAVVAVAGSVWSVPGSSDAAAVGVATVVQGLTSFALSQVVSVAGQRAIAEMRKDVQAHVLRLPVRYFDTTQTGLLEGERSRGNG